MNNPMFDDLIIFEVANNHQGDLRHGMEIINSYGALAKKYKINSAIKLQYRNLPDFIHQDFRNKDDVPHVERFLSTILSDEELRELVAAIKNNGMVAVCTPFDEESVDRCVDHGIDILKVASCSALDWPLHEKISKTEKPVIVSTGGLTISQIDKLYNFYTHRDICFALLHCLALYPLPNSAAQMNFLDRMKKRYRDIPIGYSGHEKPDENDIAKIAIAKGATILERHVGLPTKDIRLNAYSMNPQEAEQWIKAILKTREICGGKEAYAARASSKKEMDSLQSLGRGVFARTDIRKGEIFSPANTFFAMPLLPGQLSSGLLKPWMASDRDYAAKEAIKTSPQDSESSEFRRVVHEAKGMLMENQIILGDNTEFEFSHHYGRKRFREWGAILINVVNREYCKKLILILPQQQHPIHFHKLKEETFQVLSGELVLHMDGEDVLLRPGELVTVPRGARHAFRSDSGAIFEEVSTTHVKEDSFYDDERINAMDVVERKTILKYW